MSTPNLSRLLTLEAQQTASDGAGGHVFTWTALGQHFAEVDVRRGRLRARGDVVLSENTTRIRVRGAPVGAVSRPMPKQRFREGTRIWRILAVAEDDAAGRFLRCETIEEVDS